MVEGVPGLNDKQAKGIHALCRQFYVNRLSVFGSAATGGFQPGVSDYDFAVTFQKVPSTRLADQYFGLKESLEALLARPVDLVIDTAVKNRYFRAELDATAVELYAA